MRWAWLALLLLAPSVTAAVAPQTSIPAPGGYGFGASIDVVGDAAIIEADSLGGDLLGNGGRPAGTWLYERQGTTWTRTVTYDQGCQERALWHWSLTATRLIQAEPCGRGAQPEGLVETGVDVVDPINLGHMDRWRLGRATALDPITYGTSEDRVQYANSLVTGSTWWATTWETSALLRVVNAAGDVSEEEVTYQHWGVYVADGNDAQLVHEERSEAEAPEFVLAAADDILRVTGGGVAARAFTMDANSQLVPATWHAPPSSQGRDGLRVSRQGAEVLVHERIEQVWSLRDRFSITWDAELTPRSAIDIDGDVIVIGFAGRETQNCPGLTEPCTYNVQEPGHVHIYHRDQTGTWRLHEDVAGPSIYGQQFGAVVEVAGDQVLIGAPGADEDRNMYGTVYVRTMNQWPTAAFSWPADPAPWTFDKVRFTSTSTDPEGKALVHSWDFDGDGEEDATGTTPVWSWSRAGSHPVTLTVTDPEEGRDAVTFDVFVRNRPPTTDFFPTPTPVWRTAETVWENYAFDPDGHIASCTWDFGDGRSSTACEPTLAYPSKGTYTVTLTTCDDGDGQDPADQVECTTRTRDIEVFNHKPVITLTASEEPITGTPFTVTATAHDPDGTLVHAAWSDGNTDNPRSYTATRPGLLRVGYEATDDEGDRSVAWLEVDVANRPPQAAIGLPEDRATKIQLAFRDGSSDPDGRITSWHWDFGDGNTSADRSPRHAYGAKGAYTVSLEVVDDFGATAAAETVLVIDNDAPVPRIAAAVHDGIVDIQDLSFDPDGTVVARQWFVDDDEVQPTFPWTFPLPDTLQRVTLHVEDDRGTRQNTTIFLGTVPDAPTEQAPPDDKEPATTEDPPPSESDAAPEATPEATVEDPPAAAPPPGRFPWAVLLVAFLIVSAAAAVTVSRLRNPRN